MDPNNQNPVTPPVSPQQPLPPTQPYANPAPTPQFTVPPVQTVPPQKSSSQLKIWLIIVGVLLALGLIGGGLYYYLTYDKNTVTSIANKFLTAGAKDDTSTINSLAAPGDSASDKEFTRTMAAKSDDSCKADPSTFIIDKDDKPVSATIKATCDSSKKWTLSFEKTDGKWYLYGIVVSGAGATASTNETDNDETSDATTETSGVCLTQAEVSESSLYYDSGLTYSARGYQFSTTVFFSADSASLYPAYATSQQADLVGLASWVSKYSDRKFTVQVEPKVQEATLSAEGKALAVQRAQVISDILTSNGVASSKITLLDPVSESGSTDTAQAAYRNVLVQVEGDSSCK